MPAARCQGSYRRQVELADSPGPDPQGEEPVSRVFLLGRKNLHAAGIARIALETGVPVIYQVLSVYDPVQAAARVTQEVNRGREGALAAIEMARL